MVAKGIPPFQSFFSFKLIFPQATLEILGEVFYVPLDFSRRFDLDQLQVMQFKSISKGRRRSKDLDKSIYIDKPICIANHVF